MQTPKKIRFANLLLQLLQNKVTTLKWHQQRDIFNNVNRSSAAIFIDIKNCLINGTDLIKDGYLSTIKLNEKLLKRQVKYH